MLDNREKIVVDNAKSLKCRYQMGRAYPVMVDSRQKNLLFCYLSEVKLALFFERAMMARRNLNEIEKERIRENIISGAKFFEDKLAEKTFVIVTENQLYFDVSFHRKDFLHLTGLSVNIAPLVFYEACLNGTFAISNMNERQKYSRNTLLDKSDGVANLNRFIHSDGSVNLYLDIIDTNTDIMPAGIFNPLIGHTIGFKGSDNGARSMRTENTPPDNGGVYRIAAIFEINPASLNADKIIYLSELYDISAGLLEVNSLFSSDLIDKLKTIIDQSES